MLLADIIILCIGLGLLLKSSDELIKHLTTISRAIGMSEVLVGLIFASIGTSLPEIFTSILSAMEGVGGIAIGNIYGSQIAQITLMVGIVAIRSILKPGRDILERDSIMLISAAVFLVLVTLDSAVTRLEALLGIILYVSYLLFILSIDRKRNHETKKEKLTLKPIMLTLFFLILLIIGAKFSVDSAATIAHEIGISDYLIGLLIIGVGTSLPELAIAISAAKKQSKIAIGTLVGSNITDPLFSLSIGALFGELVVDADLRFDGFFFIFVTLVSVAFMYRKEQVTRMEGALLIGLFAIFALIKIITAYYAGN